ncbi:hypothetical protein K1719_007076 [Acacia pycnantha]|nr:hypothetical protein K1719_007076 [Acacia pycnantha]
MIYGADLVNQAREIVTPELVGQLSNAIKVHQKKLQVGIKLNEVVCGSVINGFARYDNLEELVKYIQKKEGSGISSNLNVWLSSLKSYCKIGSLEGATTIYQRMTDVKGGLAIVACSCMIGLLDDLSMVFEFKLVFGNLKEKDLTHGGTYVVMMYLYDRMSILDDAIEIAEEMKLLGLLKDCVSYNKLLMCYVINRKLHKSCPCFCLFSTYGARDCFSLNFEDAR